MVTKLVARPRARDMRDTFRSSRQPSQRRSTGNPDKLLALADEVIE
jgi:hypothetical protein